MNAKLVPVGFFLIILISAVSGCGPKTSSNQGIQIVTTQCQGDSTQLPSNVCLVSPEQPLPGIPISGNEVPGGDYYNTAGADLSIGSVTGFGYTITGDSPETTDDKGIAFISG